MVANIAVDAPHRHIVFTIPKEIRSFFRKDRSSLNLLFIASRNTICSITNSSKVKKLIKHDQLGDYTYLLRNNRHINEFGMISCLHTFGRDLKWNPHIHALVPELIYNPDKDTVTSFNHFNFKKLRKTFQYELLRLMSKHFGISFSSIKNSIYRNHGKGFYVYAKYTNYDLSETSGIRIDDIRSTKDRISYIMRYSSRPAMAESRIISFDSESNTITWFYNRHEDESYTEVTESGAEFLKKLIVHIPDSSFSMIRYYGFYNNRKRKSLEKIYLLLSQKKQSRHLSLSDRKKKFSSSNRKYRVRTFIMDSYNRDILLCPCGETMIWFGAYNPLEGVRNDKDYRRKCIDEMREMRLQRRGSRLGSG